MAMQLKIQIKGITRPPVWRRILIPDTFTFRQLHYAIQLAFDWLTEHLYQFQEKPFGQGWCIGEPDGDDDMFSLPTMPATEVNVRQFIEANGINKFVYVYDFGDSWVHEIMVEAINDDKIKLPRCLDGTGAPPPEDCGGAYGYEDLKQILVKKKPTEEELDRLAWYGMYDDEEEEWRYDINFCDIDQINYDFKHFNSFAKQLDDVYDGEEFIIKDEEEDISQEDMDDVLDSFVSQNGALIHQVIHNNDNTLLPKDITPNIKRIQKKEALAFQQIVG